jgi:hypothetical protein
MKIKATRSPETTIYTRPQRVTPHKRVIHVSRDRIHTLISCNKEVRLFGYMFELLRFLNFRHGSIVHINTYIFACFMNTHIFRRSLFMLHIFFLKLYLFFQFYIQIFNHHRVYIFFPFRIGICCIFDSQHFAIRTAS